MKHTPGPWEVKTWKVPDGHGIVRADVIAPQRESYIVAVPDPVWRDGSARIGVTNLAMPQEEYIANATLIAGAPELLEASKEAHLILSVFLPFELRTEILTKFGIASANRALERLGIAIARARGELP